MKRPIFLKVFLSYLLLILALSGVLLAYVFSSYSSHAVDTMTMSLSKLGYAVEHIVKPLLADGRYDEVNELLKKIEKDIRVRTTIIDSQGVVLADSEYPVKLMENHHARPEIRSALDGVMGRAVRYSTTLSHDMLYVALPMKSDPGNLYVIRMSVPLENIDPLLARVKKHTLELAFIIIVSSLLVALFFSHMIAAPIHELHRASRRIAAGDFKARVTLRGGDEIQDLSQSFNEMSERLEQSFTDLSNSKEELEGIISSMTEGLLVLDAEGRVLLMNRSAHALTGTDHADGRHYWELVRSAQLNSLFDAAASVPLSDEIELGDKVYLCSITPIRSGRARIILFHDITEMKRMERIKKDLVVNVSHELRTPLTAIKGFTETLLDEKTGEGSEYLEIIKRHTDRLINIINDLLDLSEIEAREVRIEQEDVNIRPLVEGVLSLFGQRLAAKGLKVSIEDRQGDVVVRGDPFRLEQLFTNLIDNAVKYTEEGGITITLERSPGNAVIRVADTGIGIGQEHLDRIFERFYVVDKSRSRRLGGTGLGLSIVKRIVSLHKGTISIASRPLEGTTFTITLPLA